MPSNELKCRLQIVAQFHGSPIFLAGTYLECKVSVQNANNLSEPHFSVSGLIGHVVGQFKLDEKVINRKVYTTSSQMTPPLDEIGTPASPLYFDASSLLLSTLSAGTSLLYSAPLSPCINHLAEDSGEKSSYDLSLQLPAVLPPSIRGSLFKVAYKLLVAVQVEFSEPGVGKATALLQVPVRILPNPGLHQPPIRMKKVNPFWISTDQSSDNADGPYQQRLAPRSPITAGSVRNSLLAATTAASSTDRLNPVPVLASSAGPVPDVHRPAWIDQWIESTAAYANVAGQAANFNISCQYGPVARLYLMRTVFRLGDPVRGYFDFTNAAVTCLKFTLSLQSTECCFHSTDPAAASPTPSTVGSEIANPAFTVSLPGVASDTPTNGQEYEQVLPPVVNTHEEQDYRCLSYLFMPFSLPIPVNMSPGFCARSRLSPGLVVDYRWHLRLTFDLAADESLTGSGSPGQTWTMPSDVAVQRLTWSLPIQLFAPDPYGLPPSNRSVFTEPIVDVTPS